MKSIIAALAAIACTVVSAQKITSSRPALNQVLVAGSTAQIVWAPVEGVISTIDLRQGDKNALSFLQTIATNVPANTGTYNWDVPATLPAGTDYAFSFGQSPDESYGPYFTISTGNDSAPAPSNSAPAAGTSVAPKPTGSAATSPAVSKTGAAPS
ncbi:hypothetical protein INT48_005449 [Thamnidium elegans]|uniref:Yeast cell wall synthesis Kre9/Knh1-like N-terminal domain-containing protein n=1 Tax=Thamnidium elegans TaxID=101142 RepID=A0A8H7SJV3_9FUNG|nr:hypothetical protein INT48_005449 [Thamnidium elegans]